MFHLCFDQSRFSNETREGLLEYLGGLFLVEKLERQEDEILQLLIHDHHTLGSNLISGFSLDFLLKSCDLVDDLFLPVVHLSL